MNRREFLGTGAAAMTSGFLSTDSGARSSDASEATGDRGLNRSKLNGHSLTIRDYLCREAERITARALADYTDAEAWQRLIPERRRQYLDMMGVSQFFAPESRPPLEVQVTGTVDRPAYRIEKLHYQSLPGLYVTANLYVPKKPLGNGRAPGVLYVCGHGPDQKVYYQAHPRRFAQLGFVSLLVETIELGEVAGNHHGCYRDGLFQWYSRGYSPAAVEMWNGIRALDLLAQRPEVDPDHLGVTGSSGGGAATWWIASGDERIKAAAPSCGTATLEAHIYDRVIDGHCDCMWWPNSYGWDLADVGALIAPRPLLIASADHDGIFPIDSIRRVHSQLAGLYGKLHHPENLRLVETPGGHSYHARSRTAISSWFLKHLAGKEVPPEQVGDFDESPPETLDTLRVYVNGLPENNRTLTIAQDFVPLAKPPVISTASELESERRRVVAALRVTTFHAFPKHPPALDVREEFSLDGGSGCRFAYTSEDGFRLHGKLLVSAGDDRRPAVVVLRSPGEERDGGEALAGRIHAPWAKVVVEPRGTGDTAWGEELNWHLRRAAAWTGRTLASLRLWDTLRAIQAVRALSRVDGAQISLATREEMCAVALYAALLDGGIRTLFLESPPATQNMPSQPDGRGPAMEMLGCLRITDLPHIAGLLFPTEIVIAGDFPTTFEWPAALYGRLGKPDHFRKLQELSSWQA